MKWLVNDDNLSEGSLVEYENVAVSLDMSLSVVLFTLLYNIRDVQNTSNGPKQINAARAMHIRLTPSKVAEFFRKEST